MNPVAHFVCGKRASDFFDNFFPWLNFGERERPRRTFQPIEMFVKFENSAVVES